MSPKCYSSSSKCQLLPVLLLDHYLCVCARACVCVCTCARIPSCLSNSINKCTYIPPLQKPCLFTVPHKLLTLWTLSSLAQFNVQSQQQQQQKEQQQQQQKVSTIHNYSQTTICTFMSNLPSILSAAQTCHHLTNTKLAMYLLHLPTLASEFLGLSNATYTCPYHSLSHKPTHYPLLQATVRFHTT